MMQEKTEKIYCYVDESGQDTKGKFFIVSLVVTGKERDQLNKELIRIETETNKKSTKWSKTKKEIQIQYIERVFQSPKFKNKIHYVLKEDTKAYQEITVLAVATAINKAKNQDNYKASVYIDGLDKFEVRKISVKLRQIGIKTEKVRGIRDESSAFIRLADAIAGLIGRSKKAVSVNYTHTLIDLGRKKNVLNVLQ